MDKLQPIKSLDRLVFPKAVVALKIVMLPLPIGKCTEGGLARSV